MINEKEQIALYIEDKRPTTTPMWIIYGIVAFAIVGVSGWVNWQFGASRAGYGRRAKNDKALRECRLAPPSLCFSVESHRSVTLVR